MRQPKSPKYYADRVESLKLKLADIEEHIFNEDWDFNNLAFEQIKNKLEQLEYDLWSYNKYEGN